jgi:tripartite-type tricarboxylate transporter receptor subunit TctC
MTSLLTVTRIARQFKRCLLQALAVSLALAAPAWADWPADRPIHLIVPFPAGSSPDLLARTLVDPLSKALAQTIVVENRVGAGGNIGTRYVANAAGDGYTLLYTINGPLVTAPTLYKKTLGYDPMTDLAPVTLVATSPNVLVVSNAVGADTLAAFVDKARAQPGKLNYGSVGAGSASHLAMEMFKERAGIDLMQVPYPGFPQITTAIIAGDIQAAFMVPAIAMPQVRNGKMRALAITSAQPVAALQGIDTVSGQGYPGFEAISWNAILAPASTPAPVIATLQKELATIIRSDDIAKKFAAQYFSAVGSTPAELRNLMQQERQRWDTVIDRLQLSLD